MLFPFIACLAIASLPSQQAKARRSTRPLISVSPNIKENGGVADLVKNLQDLRSAGLEAMYVSVKWNDLEPDKGKLNLKPIDDAVNGLGGLGFKLAVTIQTLDTNNRVLPADLMGKPFDLPEVRERFDALLRVVVPRFREKVRWLMLGNEVDVYLGEHPSELEPFAAFVERGRKVARDIRPGIPVGVTCTFDGARARSSHFNRLNCETYVVTLTYYPLSPDFAVRPVSSVPADISQMVEMAGSRQLLIQEAGYPADPLLGSSDNKQADFVDAVFDAARKHKNRIALVNFFLLVDFNDALLETFLKYYRLPNARFRAFLATLGFQRKDGTARKSYDVFLRRLHQWNDEREKPVTSP